MKLIYISGAYTAPTPDEVQLNIELARYYAVKLWQQSWGVHCPHLNTAGFEQYNIPYERFMEFDLILLRRGWDAVFALPNWMHSNGAKREIEFAEKLGIPIVHSLEEAEKLLKS